jgi:long-chain acyl-CoA synthetase
MSRPTTRSLREAITASPSADFLIQPERKFSFADLTRGLRQWLSAFDAHGIAPGERVVMRTSDDQAAITFFLAAMLDGVVPVVLSAETPAHRVRALCGAVEAALFVADAGFAAGTPMPPTIALTAPAPRRFALRAAPMVPALAFTPAERAPRLPLDEAGLAYILFTSGTTAAPSGVCISRGNLFANLATLSRVFGYDAHSRIFNDMILAHADGMIQGPVLAALNGCAVIRSGGFQIGRIEEWLNRVRSARATHVITVPTIWAMIDGYAAHDDYFDAPECRSLLSVAAKLPEPLWQRLETRFKRPVFNQYGLTETVASALYAGPQAEMGAFGTVGKPIDCEARIDPAASGADGAGELQLRGDNVFAGYWGDPARTAASFVEGGWLKTGDLARLRSDGSFDVLGRIKAVIMTGGFLIHPDEIDEAMLLHPAVQESATVGMADAMFDEVPLTAVVTRAPTDENTLTEHARTHLEPQKVPKRIIALAAIPRGESGKANLAALRTALEQALGAAAPDRSADETQQAVLAAAADVFRVSPGALSLRTAQGDIAGWDSFSQISLVLTVEQSLGVRIPASRIAVIRSLGDLVSAVEVLRR